MGIGARLFVHSEGQHLGILLQGIASSSGMKYCPASLPGKLAPTCAHNRKGIWVIGVTEIREEHLIWTRSLSRELAFPVILVADVLPRKIIPELLRSGAVACVRTNEALQELPSIIANLARCLLRDD